MSRQALRFSYYSLIAFIFCNTFNHYPYLTRRTIAEPEIQYSLMPSGEFCLRTWVKLLNSVNAGEISYSDKQMLSVQSLILPPFSEHHHFLGASIGITILINRFT